MHNRLASIFVLVTLLLACSRSEKEEKLPELAVTVIQGSYHAVLFWESPAGNLVYRYKVFIGDSLVSDQLSSNTCRINSLKALTEYQGRIEAWSDAVMVANGEFRFTTPEDLPPAVFSIRSVITGNHSATLEWEASVDPEGGPVTYDLYLDEQLVVSGLSNQRAELNNLDALTTYRALIAAKDSAGNTRQLLVNFSTILHDHSLLVHEYRVIQNRLREFCWYLPKTYPSSGNPSLVIFLHGANGIAWSQMQTSYFRTIADRENFIFLMPQALQGTFIGSTLYQWNAHYIFPWDDAAFINYLIDYIDTKFQLDRNRVYLTGMSNGGFMTFFAARELQDRIAAIAPIAGLISMNVFQGYTLNRPMPLCYMHGTDDNIVVMNGSPSLQEVLDLYKGFNGCTGAPQITDLPDINTNDQSSVRLHQYSGNAEIFYYEIIGGGHSIPGVEPGANMDINAFEEIWKFFSRQSLKEG